jgi:PPOX class probable F420-dependent enzyme
MGSILTDSERAFLRAERTATLATTAADGRPRLVPICFVLADLDDDRGRPLLYTPLDEKAKRDLDPRTLARVRDILVLPEVTLLVDRWDEDWSRLAWIRLYGHGELLEPQAHERAEHARAVQALRDKYPQYHDQAIDARPIIRISCDRAIGWGAID